jgi:DNA-directed RNA polymerase specialized sigma24 family protein
MEHRDIIKMLNYPDTALVQHAISRANLTDPEWEVIHARVYNRDSAERAAERLELSTRTVNRRYRDGMDKLDMCWNGIPWINRIIKQ